MKKVVKNYRSERIFLFVLGFIFGPVFLIISVVDIFGPRLLNIDKPYSLIALCCCIELLLILLDDKKNGKHGLNDLLSWIFYPYLSFLFKHWWIRWSIGLLILVFIWEIPAMVVFSMIKIYHANMSFGNLFSLFGAMLATSVAVGTMAFYPWKYKIC